jgi:hypothetical protein
MPAGATSRSAGNMGVSRKRAARPSTASSSSAAAGAHAAKRRCTTGSGRRAAGEDEDGNGSASGSADDGSDSNGDSDRDDDSSSGTSSSSGSDSGGDNGERGDGGEEDGEGSRRRAGFASLKGYLDRGIRMVADACSYSKDVLTAKGQTKEASLCNKATRCGWLRHAKRFRMLAAAMRSLGANVSEKHEEALQRKFATLLKHYNVGDCSGGRRGG